MALAGAQHSGLPPPLTHTRPGKKGKRGGPHPYPKAYPSKKAGFWASALASPSSGSLYCSAHPPGPL